MIKIKVKDHNKLAELIYRSGNTIRSLARKTDISDTTLQLMTTGKREGCGPEVAKKIVDTLDSLGVKFDDIFFVVQTDKSKIYDSSSSRSNGTE